MNSKNPELTTPSSDRKISGEGVTPLGDGQQSSTENSLVASEELPEKDGIRAWMVCLGGYGIQVFILGVLHAFGVFYIHLTKEFNASKGQTAWVASGAYGITMFFAPLASTFIRKFGHRPVAMAGCAICSVSLFACSYVRSIEMMFVTFTFLYGFGACLAYTPTMCIAAEFFDKHMTVATGIMVAGSSSGTLVVSPISQSLIEVIGWRGAFRVLAAFQCTFCLLGGFAFKPLPVAQTTSPDHPDTSGEHIRLATSKPTLVKRIVKDFELWKNRVFVVWVTAMILVNFGYYIPYVHLVSFAADNGVSAEDGALIMAVFGASTAAGRLLFGKVIQWGFLNRVHLHQLSMVITGVGSMLLPLLTTFGGLLVYVIVLGLVDGCFVVLIPVLTTTLMGAEQTVLAWGFTEGCSALTFTLGPPIAGWLRDALGTYDVAFHVGGIPVILGALILFFIPWAQRTSTSTNLLTSVALSSSATLEALVEEEVESSAQNDVTEPAESTSRTPIKEDSLLQFDIDIGEDELGSYSARATPSGGTQNSAQQEVDMFIVDGGEDGNVTPRALSPSLLSPQQINSPYGSTGASSFENDIVARVLSQHSALSSNSGGVFSNGTRSPSATSAGSGNYMTDTPISGRNTEDEQSYFTSSSQVSPTNPFVTNEPPTTEL